MSAPRPRRGAAAPVLGLAMALLAWAAPRTARAEDPGFVGLPKPAQRVFILDQAQVIAEEDEAAILKTCESLLADEAVPMVVVAVGRLKDHLDPGAGALSIESFASRLYEHWDISQAKRGKRGWNKGALVLVAVQDRKARIELGAGFGWREDEASRRIMDEQLLPRFKRGEYSAGIRAGVEGLDRMVRGENLPLRYRAPAPAWLNPVLAIAGLVFVLTLVSLFRSGQSGWAWIFWAGLFSAIGAALYWWYRHAPRRRRGFWRSEYDDYTYGWTRKQRAFLAKERGFHIGGSSGRSSRGSSGGRSSGGRGASGSW